MAAVATGLRRDSGSAEPRAGRSAERLFEPGGLTLEDVVLGAWEALVADGRAECPVCGGAMSMLDG
ncbi:MAG: hypothetical protein ACRDL3_15415, partial [Solirubrobacterales bacterium]